MKTILIILPILFVTYPSIAQTDSTDLEVYLTNESDSSAVSYDCIYPIETMPTFPGGYDSLKSYFKRNMKVKPRLAHISGRVFVQFTVDTTGAIREAKVIKGLNDYLDSEALRLIKNAPKFIPGEFRGVKTKTRMIIPISFN